MIAGRFGRQQQNTSRTSHTVGVDVRLAAARENGWKALETFASFGLNGRDAGKMEPSADRGD